MHLNIIQVSEDDDPVNELKHANLIYIRNPHTDYCTAHPALF